MSLLGLFFSFSTVFDLIDYCTLVTLLLRNLLANSKTQFIIKKKKSGKKQWCNLKDMVGCRFLHSLFYINYIGMGGALGTALFVMFH